jgi:biopolymer transport protein ExbD
VPLLMDGYDVDIPRASTDVVAAQSAEDQLILSIAPTTCSILAPPAGEGVPADCSVTLADKKIPAADLPGRVAEILGGLPTEKRVLFLDADDSLNYEGVLRIVDLAKSGVDDLKIEFLTTH